MSETSCEFYSHEDSTRFVARLVVEPGTLSRVDKVGTKPPYGLDTYKIANPHAVCGTLRVEARDQAAGMHVEEEERHGEYFETSHLTVGKPLLATPGPTPTETVRETPRLALDIEEITSCIGRAVNEPRRENDLRGGVIHCIEEKVIKPLGIPVKIRHDYKLPGGNVDAVYEVDGIDGKVVVKCGKPSPSLIDFVNTVEQTIKHIEQLPGDWTRHVGVIISFWIGFVWYDSTQKRWMREGPLPINRRSVKKLVSIFLSLKETPNNQHTH
ncbi:MAG: hypothetical protein ACK4SY_10635 [Pyrobaculum sp.]